MVRCNKFLTLVATMYAIVTINKITKISAEKKCGIGHRFSEYQDDCVKCRAGQYNDVPDSTALYAVTYLSQPMHCITL